MPYLGWRQNGTNTAACYFGPVAVYTCPAGATLSGTSCIAPVSQAATVSYYSCSSGTLSGTNCITTTTGSLSYSCPAGQSLSGTSCLATSTSSVAGTPIYGCPGGYTLSGSSCTLAGTATQAATASFSCASGALSGAYCLNALSRTRYEAYGGTAAGAVPNGLGFTGHVNDADSGLVYMQQRYYDSIAGRFLSVDPIVTDANTGSGFNVYEYAQSNPYKYTDPDGRMDAQICTPACGGLSGSIWGSMGSMAQRATPLGSGAGTVQFAANSIIDEEQFAGKGRQPPFATPRTPAEQRANLDYYREKNAAKEAQAASKVFSKEKQALVDMAKADKKTGVTRADMKAYQELNKGLKDPFPANKVRTDEGHLRGAPHSQVPHGHVGPVDHIPVLDP